MRRSATVLMVLVVVVGMVGAVPMTGVAQPTTTDEPTETPTPTDDGAENETDGNETAPGDLLEGVVGVQEAELEGEIENRTFGIQVAQAATEDAKAEVVADRLATVEERLNDLEAQKEDLNESRANGNISEAEYRNRIAELAVRTNNTKQLLDSSANVSESLPNETLEANGINATAIRTLAERADELTGPEVAEIARSIAGPSVAVEASDGASERRGPPGDGSGSSAAGASQGGNQTASGDQPSETPDGADNADSGSDAADSGSDNAGSGDSDGSGGSDGRP